MPRWYKEFAIIKYVKKKEIIRFDIFLTSNSNMLVICIEHIENVNFHKMPEFLA